MAVSVTSSPTSSTSYRQSWKQPASKLWTRVAGIPQKPIEDVSFMHTFDAKNADAPSRHHTQYFEMMGDHAIYHEGWIASTKVMLGGGGGGEPS
jgi:hypothetical protein